MCYLSEKAHFLSMDEFIGYYVENKSVPNYSVLITFDDGYRDNYTEAFPILRKYNAPATIFLTSNMIGSSKSFWWDDLAWILEPVSSIEEIQDVAGKLGWRPPFHREDIITCSKWKKTWKIEYYELLTKRIKSLRPNEIELLTENLKTLSNHNNSNGATDVLSWKEVREMGSHGISFGSHSSDHNNLTQLSKSELIEELYLSKRSIEENVQKEVLAFSYPYGFFDDRCKSALQEMGYKVAFTTRKSYDNVDHFSVPRISVKRKEWLGIAVRFSVNLFCLELAGFLKKFSTNRFSLIRR